MDEFSNRCELDGIFAISQWDSLNANKGTIFGNIWCAINWLRFVKNGSVVLIFYRLSVFFTTLPISWWQTNKRACECVRVCSDEHHMQSQWMEVCMMTDFMALHLLLSLSFSFRLFASLFQFFFAFCALKTAFLFHRRFFSRSVDN